jgi:hypothetical protein
MYAAIKIGLLIFTLIQMKKVAIVVVGIFITCFFITCRKKDKDECPACPEIDALSPATGKKGDTVLISGSNFSAVLKNNIVKFNGTAVAPGNMISGSTTQLKVLVPAKCGTGPVTVTLDDELYSDNGPVFTYNYATVVSIFAGSPIGISGNTAGGTTFLKTLFNAPTQVAVDASNNVYVLDDGNKTIRKLNITTGLDAVLSNSSSQVSNPCALAVDENYVVYASSYNTTSQRSTVYKYTPGSSSPVIYFSDFDTGKKHLSLTCEGNGQFYIGRITANLSLYLPDINHYSTKGNEPFADGAGNVVFYKNGYVYQINSIVASMIYQTEFSKYSVKDTVETPLINAAGGLNMSLGLVVDDEGNAYISDTQNNRILKYSSTGVVTELLTGLSAPQGLAMDKLGNIYVAETGKNCIKKINFD